MYFLSEKSFENFTDEINKELLKYIGKLKDYTIINSITTHPDLLFYPKENQEKIQSKVKNMLKKIQDNENCVGKKGIHCDLIFNLTDNARLKSAEHMLLKMINEGKYIIDIELSMEDLHKFYQSDHLCTLNHFYGLLKESYEDMLLKARKDCYKSMSDFNGEGGYVHTVF